MQPPSQASSGTVPQQFRYSLDWRFLLPMDELNHGVVLVDEAADLDPALAQLSFPDTQRRSFSDLRADEHESLRLIVMPFGLPVGPLSAGHRARVELYSTLRPRLAAGGNLLLGFNNRLHRKASVRSQYRPSTLQGTMNELSEAGFQAWKTFGAMPNLRIPEYIFDLSPRTIRFALQTRFRRKPLVSHTLTLLLKTLGGRQFSTFLPCYFVVATA